MTTPLLPFISDEVLYEKTKPLVTLVEKTSEEQEQQMYRNTIDPFSALFDAAKQNITLSEWLNQEKSRQVQKTLQNAIGTFHQEILGSMHGWESLQVGGIIDVKNDQEKIVAEIKNKHNTTNSSSAEALYDHLSNVLNNKYLGYTAYYVQIIPKSRREYNKPYIPSGKQLNEKIRVIDGKSFYAMASGHQDALKMLYMVLPKVISDILQRPTDNVTKDKLFMELFEKAYS
jgi:hypothetical protein